MQKYSKINFKNNGDESLIEIKNHVYRLKKEQSSTSTFKNLKNETEDYQSKNHENIKFASVEETYRTIFENSAVAIMLTDEHERIVSWNKYAENLLGMNNEDLHLKPVRSLYPSEEWTKIRAENIRQKGMQHHLETKMLKKNKQSFDVDVSLSVLKDNKGKIIGSIGIIRDISDRKETQRRLQSLMDYADDSIYMVDRDTKYILVNNQLLLRIGLSKEHILGKTFDEIHSPVETKEFTENINKVFKTGEPIKSEHKVERLGKWFLRTLSPIKDASNNKVKSVLVISKDITSIKDMEVKLHQNAEYLEAANQELTAMNEELISSQEELNNTVGKLEKLMEQKNDFIHMLSHDLKNSLLPLTLSFPIMKQKIKDPKLKEILQNCVNSTKKMQEMISKIIGLALLDDIEEKIKFNKVNLYCEVDSTIKNLQQLLDANNFKVENLIDNKIVIKADRLRLGEVFNNLITNSVKYKSDEEPGNIIIDAKDEKDFITISIKDNGMGMTKEEICCVFNKFYKTRNSGDSLESSGLGLAICNAIAKKHNGRIWVESPGKGKGSTFYFSIPKKY
jgi:PAS domain S-box-containing protein